MSKIDSDIEIKNINKNAQSENKNLETTVTSMMISQLANSEKLVPKEDRWSRSQAPLTDNEPRNDDKVDDYLNDDHADVIRNTNINANNDEPPEVDVHSEYSPPNPNSAGVNLNEHYDSANAPDERLKKLDMLRKLYELKVSGVHLTQNYSMNSDYEVMKYEYELHTNSRSKQNAVNIMQQFGVLCIRAIEMGNEKYDPFSLKLGGWSDSVSSNINNYYDVFGELYERWNTPGKPMNPYLKLMLLLVGSAAAIHVSNTCGIGKSLLIPLNENLKQNPELTNSLYKQAMLDKQNSGQYRDSLQDEYNKNMQKVKDLQNLKEYEEQAIRSQRMQQVQQSQQPIPYPSVLQQPRAPTPIPDVPPSKLTENQINQIRKVEIENQKNKMKKDLNENVLKALENTEELSNLDEKSIESIEINPKVKEIIQEKPAPKRRGGAKKKKTT